MFSVKGEYMPDQYLLIVVGVIFGVFVVALLTFFPSSTHRPKKKFSKPMSENEQKDWKTVSLRMERHIHDLKRDVFELQKKEKLLSRELEVSREKENALQIKLNQERGWQKKGVSEFEKRGLEVQKLNNGLKNAEERLANEHSEFLRIQRQDKELLDEIVVLKQEKQSLEQEFSQARAQAEAYRKEILELRAENARISKKHDDTSWIAKTEYMKVKEELRVKEKELERIKRETGK